MFRKRASQLTVYTGEEVGTLTGQHEDRGVQSHRYNTHFVSIERARTGKQLLTGGRTGGGIDGGLLGSIGTKFNHKRKGRDDGFHIAPA